MSRTSRGIPASTQDKQKIVTALIRRAIADATGESIPPLQRYRGMDPAGRFWLGVLASEEEIDPAALHSEEDPFRPAAQGFSFKVSELPQQLDVELQFAVWVAVHPTLEEQRAMLADRAVDAGTDDKVNLERVRMKVPIGPVRFSVTVDERDADASEPLHCGRQEITTAIRDALRSLPGGTVLHRPLRSPGGERPRESDLKDGSWEAWERENLADPVHPEWLAEVDIDVTRYGDSYELLVTLVNRTPSNDKQYTDKNRTKKFVSWACDTNLYEARLAVSIDSGVTPIVLEQIPENFRYDRFVPALGWNSAVSWDGKSINTEYAAEVYTERIYPRTAETDPDTGVDVRFSTLIQDPIPALRNLLDRARSWQEQMWSPEFLERLASENQWEPDALDAAKREAEEARMEIEWVETGLKVLEDDPQAIEAFKLMNRTMERAASGYDSWRPFQIAFILGCLSGLIQPGNDLHVDILWFPTGGGKTEAYLGLNAFYLFYQRLKGYTWGTNTWARFPLRLLSLQQTQRFATSVLHAEIVRRSTPTLSEGEPFGIGYLVGSSNTPNKIYLPGSKYYKGWDPDEKAETCRVLEFCPGCGERPIVRFEKADHTLEHLCQTEGCPLEGRLPVYVIDDDIYRRAPSVIVGTVDKVTQISWNSGFRHLLGRAHGYCKVHGLSNRVGRCAIYECDEPLQGVPGRLAGIGLEVLDEMHLLSEELGSLDGNYETLFHAIAEELDLPPIKVIGATATIEGYKEQSAHLFRREPRRFPLPGPEKSESFWAFENPGDPLRTYVALLPRGTTMLNAAFWLTWSHRSFLDEALSDLDEFCTRLGIPQERKRRVEEYLRELYGILTTYALRRQELTRYRRDITEDQTLVPDHAWAEITGDVDFWDVREVLNRLSGPDPDDEVRVLGATSAISHGVDVDRLNVMCVLGMPNQVSEFIQATARVGRTHPGLVFCLINPYRRRDVSQFRYFTKWAEYVDRLVEHVPVNRESLQVLKLVLPGGFMAWLLQVDDPVWLTAGSRRDRRKSLSRTQGAKDAVNRGFLTEDRVSERLESSFDIPEGDPRFTLHREYIREFSEKIIHDIQAAGGEDKVSDVLTQAGYPVPRSLRDVETTIEIRGER